MSHCRSRLEEIGLQMSEASLTCTISARGPNNHTLATAVVRTSLELRFSTCA
jgi:hypothetical protein